MPALYGVPRGPLAIAQQAHDQARHRRAQEVVRVAQVEAAQLADLPQPVLHGVDVDVQLARARASVASRTEVALERREERAPGARVALEDRPEPRGGERLELRGARAVDEEPEDPELVGAERPPPPAEAAQDVDAARRPAVRGRELG